MRQDSPSPPSDTPPAVGGSRPLRWLLWLVGTVSLGLGLLGVVLPGLPTTPFVLLAAACYAKASPRLHRWLLDHRWLGPMVTDWERHRSLTRRTKTIALVSMATMVSVSIWSFQDKPAVQLVLFLAALVGGGVVARIPTRPR